MSDNVSGPRLEGVQDVTFIQTDYTQEWAMLNARAALSFAFMAIGLSAMANGALLVEAMPLGSGRGWFVGGLVFAILSAAAAYIGSLCFMEGARGRAGFLEWANTIRLVGLIWFFLSVILIVLGVRS